MNSIAESVKTHLVVINDNDYVIKLYKLCLEKLKTGCWVLIITSNVYDFSKLVQEMNISRDQLTKFIIMHFNKIDEISQKILQLYSWSLLPSLVAVDLIQLLANEVNSAKTSATIMQKVAFCCVSLLTYLQSIVFQRSNHENSINPMGQSQTTINGLLILKPQGENFNSNHIEMLKNLYFYKTELCYDIIDLQSLMQDGDGV